MGLKDERGFTEFKIGDRVIALEDEGGYEIGGQVGVVVLEEHIWRKAYVAVEFDQNIGGHNLEGYAARGHGLYVSRLNLAHYELPELAPPMPFEEAVGWD